MTFRDLKPGDKLLLFVGASLILLTVFALAVFVSLSLVSLLTWSAPHILWNVCFLLCAVSLGGWMLFYTGQLRIGGVLMLFRSNILLLYSLILAVLISAIVRFPGRQKYVALVALGLALAGFNFAVPYVTTPRRMFGLFKKEIRSGGAKP